MRFVFRRNPTGKLFHARTALLMPSLSLDGFRLRFKTTLLDPRVDAPLLDAVASGPYPITFPRRYVSFRELPQNQTNIFLRQILDTQIPNRMGVFFVENAALARAGAHNLSWCCWSPLQVRRMRLKLHSLTFPDFQGWDFSEGNGANADVLDEMNPAMMVRMLHAVHSDADEVNHVYRRSVWRKWPLYWFDLTADGNAGSGETYERQMKAGECNLEIELHIAPRRAMTIGVLCEYSSTMTVDLVKEEVATDWLGQD